MLRKSEKEKEKIETLNINKKAQAARFAARLKLIKEFLNSQNLQFDNFKLEKFYGAATQKPVVILKLTPIEEAMLYEISHVTKIDKTNLLRSFIINACSNLLDNDEQQVLGRKILKLFQATLYPNNLIRANIVNNTTTRQPPINTKVVKVFQEELELAEESGKTVEVPKLETLSSGIILPKFHLEPVVFKRGKSYYDNEDKVLWDLLDVQKNGFLFGEKMQECFIEGLERVLTQQGKALNGAWSIPRKKVLYKIARDHIDEIFKRHKKEVEIKTGLKLDERRKFLITRNYKFMFEYFRFLFWDYKIFSPDTKENTPLFQQFEKDDTIIFENIFKTLENDRNSLRIKNGFDTLDSKTFVKTELYIPED